MSFAPDILTSSDLQQRIADATAARDASRQLLLPADKIESTFQAKKAKAQLYGWCEQISFIVRASHLASLENANGAAASRFRDILQEGVLAYEPVGVYYDSGEAKGHALCAALACWEFDTAQRMATAYAAGKPVTESRDNAVGLWREAILGNARQALAFLDALPEPPHVTSPQQRELAEGVLRKDEKMIRAGLKTTSDRFKKAWTLKTWATPAQLKYYGSAARLAPDVCRRLITQHWLLSYWAVGWLSLAWQRGLTGAFTEPKYFSPWVPWELCCPEPNPLKSVRAAVAKARAAKKPAGKIQLRAELFAAALMGNVKAIENLIAQKVPLDALNQDRQTALMVAVKGNYAPVVSALIQGGADVGVQDPKGRSALGLAAESGRLEIVRTMLADGVPADPKDKPVSPLVRASRGGHLEIIRLLLDAGADPNRISAYGNSSALTDAIEQNHLEVVALLLKAGAKVNTPVEDKRTALHYAIRQKNPDLIQSLLKAGADVNAQDYWGGTVLHEAAESGSAKLVAQVIAAGADLNVPLKRDRVTALMLAVPHPECLKLLLDAGADASLRNKEKKSALDLAKEYPDSLKLIEAHARSQ